MMLWRWFGVAFGVAESPEGDGPYGSPPGRFFCAYKRDQNTVKGERFPFDEPLSVACSAGYERCKSIVRTAHRYAPKVAAGASAPFPSPSPVAGEGPSGQIAAYSGLRLGSVTFCASLLGQSQSLPPCGARKNHRAARLLDFFDRYGCSAPPPGDHQSTLNSHNKSQSHFPSKIHHLCKLNPTFPHFVNLP